jgi:hypothetical protein
VILGEARTQSTHISIQNNILSLNYYTLGSRFKYTKCLKPEDASKDTTEFAEAISLTFRTFSSS